MKKKYIIFLFLFLTLLVFVILINHQFQTKSYFVSEKKENYIESVKKYLFSNSIKNNNYSSQVTSSLKFFYLKNNQEFTNEQFAFEIAGLDGSLTWKERNCEINNCVYITCNCFDKNRAKLARIDFIYNYKHNISKLFSFIPFNKNQIDSSKFDLENNYEKIAKKLEIETSKSRPNSFDKKNNIPEFKINIVEKAKIESASDLIHLEQKLVVENENLKILDFEALKLTSEALKQDIKPDVDSQRNNEALLDENNKNKAKISFDLKDREIIESPNQVKINKHSGKVVVEIIVNANGDVIKAFAGVKGSTTDSDVLLDICEYSAIKAKFSKKLDSQKNQKGTMTFIFPE